MFDFFKGRAMRKARRTADKYADEVRRDMLEAKRKMYSAQVSFNYAVTQEDIDRCIGELQSCSETYNRLYGALREISTEK